MGFIRRAASGLWRWRPRFSLGALVCFVLLCGSGYGLWLKWEPWELEYKFSGTSAVFSDDSKRFLLYQDGGDARLFESVSGQEIFRVQAPAGGFHHAFFSPDNRKIIATCKDDTVRLYDAANGKEVLNLAVPEEDKPSYNAVRIYAISLCASFSKDGKRLLTANGHTARIWDAVTGKELHSFNGPKNGIGFVQFSPDEEQVLAHSGDGSVRAWNVCTEKEIDVLVGHMRLPSFSPNGQQVLRSSSYGGIQILDARTGKELLSLGHPDERYDSVQYSDDGLKVLAIDFNGTVRIWNAQTGKEMLVLNLHKSFTTAGFSRDGRQILTSDNADDSIKIWDAENGQELCALTGPKGLFLTTCYSPDEQWLEARSFAGANSVWIWRRRRMESRYGLFVLPEMWCTLLSLGGLGYCLFRGTRNAAA